MKTTLILCIIILASGGCTSYSPPVSYTHIGTCSNIVSLNNAPLVKEKLLEQYDVWKGTRYRSGGLGKHGVDCSGFVYVTYRSQLCIDLPRTTDALATIGKYVEKKNLMPGDLVFFKTGFFTRHVGIYVDDGKFMHASSSQGVTLSRLDDLYWSKRYWQAKRL